MRINHNIAALNTYRQLTIGQGAAAKNMEKLSSGLRINRAGDDAAGLAISEKMRGQIRGLEQASRNAQDAISLIQTAEGALNETHSILQRMRELAVQAANDTNTADDRNEIQKEIDQLKSEINRIASDTEFNTKKLLDGSISNKATLSSSGNTANILSATIIDDNIAAGNYTVNVSSVSITQTVSTTQNETNLTSFSSNGAKVGDYTVTLTQNGSNWDIVIKDSNGNEVGSAVNQSIDTSSTSANVNVGNFTLTWNQGTTVQAGDTSITIEADATFTVKDSSGALVQSTTITDNKTGEVSVGGFNLTFNDTLTNSSSSDDTQITVETDALSFQIGANQNQNTKLAISNMSSAALGVNNIDVTTQENANEAITTVNDAIIRVSAERSKLGAIQNRLEHTINNLGTSAENLTASESRIRDVDYALAA
ncbi:hypothetical protein M493_16260 [Geobacillus genomosp. 3]|uniref:Flagellin n=1 Tax=Geobacillus genomosp. 3 TaxID=1921421 RepID=S6A3W6_GEOG3|nr:flagellin [Geobacillus genomosp. 3]AGT33466.1 hypothetical protein M493_16260 [Geobacillus genomosp. 3]